MNKIFAVLVGVLCACPVWAAGLDLSWNTCATDGGLSDVVFDCANPGGAHDLFGTFTSDVAVPDVVRFEYVIDMQVDAQVVPDFWVFGGPSGNYVGSENGSCPGAAFLWGFGASDGYPLTYESGPGPSRARFVGSRSTGAGTVHIDTGASYFGSDYSFPLGLRLSRAAHWPAAPHPWSWCSTRGRCTPTRYRRSGSSGRARSRTA